MAVGSSACRANVDFVLNELKVFQRFAVTVSSDDVVHAKPAPDIFLKAASDIGIEPSRALVIEDSLIGIASAKAAGMRVAGLSTTHTEAELAAADYVVRDFLHLMELISDLLVPGRVQGVGAA
jgi:beta-phosphoglucomutase-like phosphatase (HAD superfamily)